MRRSWIVLLPAISAALALAVAGAAFAEPLDDTTSRAVFAATLTGPDENPPTTSSGTGYVSFLLSQTDKTLYYSLQVTAATSQINAAHIHLAPEGKNGPIVVLLCGSGGPACGQEGIVATGSITASSLTGPLAGKSLSDLLNAMNSGDTYVNVHTANFPDGELRGQVAALDGGADMGAKDEKNNVSNDVKSKKQSQSDKQSQINKEQKEDDEED